MEKKQIMDDKYVDPKEAMDLDVILCYKYDHDDVDSIDSIAAAVTHLIPVSWLISENNQLQFYNGSAVDVYLNKSNEKPVFSINDKDYFFIANGDDSYKLGVTNVEALGEYLGIKSNTKDLANVLGKESVDKIVEGCREILLKTLDGELE